MSTPHSECFHPLHSFSFSLYVDLYLLYNNDGRIVCLQFEVVSPVQGCFRTGGRSTEAGSLFNGRSVQTQHTTKLSYMSLTSWKSN